MPRCCPASDALHQVFDNPLRAGREHALGNLAARLERAARQRDAPLRATQLELQDAFVVGEHDEAALGAGDVNRRVEHEREHLVEHPSGPERAQPFEQARHVAQLARGESARSIGRCRLPR